MKNNEELQTDVEKAIKWEPLLHMAEIGVTADNGIVTLSGVVDSYSKKCEAENAAKNVTGVKRVIEKIEVSLYSSRNKRTDGEVAYEVVSSIHANRMIPNDKIHVTVQQGNVKLDGKLEWNYQKELTEKMVGKLYGVKGVVNNIEIDSKTDAAIEKRDIKEALRRNWSINADHINIDVSGTKVTLTGSVAAWYQKNEAERIAWNAPGVKTVDNNLEIEFVLQ